MQSLHESQKNQYSSVTLALDTNFILHLETWKYFIQSRKEKMFLCDFCPPSGLYIFHVSAQFNENRHNMLSNTIVCQRTLRPSFSFLLILFQVDIYMLSRHYIGLCVVACTFIYEAD